MPDACSCDLHLLQWRKRGKYSYLVELHECPREEEHPEHADVVGADSERSSGERVAELVEGHGNDDGEDEVAELMPGHCEAGDSDREHRLVREGGRGRSV